MHKLLLASSTCFILVGGIALAHSDSSNQKNSDSNQTSSLDITKTLKDVGNSYLSTTRTDTQVDVRLATSSTNGNIDSTLTVAPGGNGSREASSEVKTGEVEMNSVNGGSGLLTAQQNSGFDSLPQNTVSLGSAVSGSSTGFNGL